jgi:hypothetical protein
VVEDEAHLGAAADQFHGRRELVVGDADVESEVEPRQELHALDETRPQAELGVRLVLEQPADAAAEVVRGELLEVGRDRGAALERGVGDDRLDARIALGQPRVGGLLQTLSGVGLDLDPDQRLGGPAGRLDGGDRARAAAAQACGTRSDRGRRDLRWTGARPLTRSRATDHRVDRSYTPPGAAIRRL